MLGVELDHCQLIFSLITGARGFRAELSDERLDGHRNGGTDAGRLLILGFVTDDSASVPEAACHESPAKSNPRFPAAYHTRGNSVTASGAGPA